MDVMIDIETLGNKPGCPVVAIAAVKFDRITGETFGEFYRCANFDSALRYGRPDGSTLQWWFNQHSDAIKEVASGVDDIEVVIGEFFSFIDAKDLVWGNGASFDISILEVLANRMQRKIPWKFWNVRDVRTVVDIGLMMGFDPKRDMPFEGVMHNALDDSKHQAKYVSAILSRIGG